jgi:hypothetical protein
LVSLITQDARIENLIVTNVISHDSGGDLLGNLSHNGQFAVLNNHRAFQGNFLQWIYDDSDSGDIAGSQPVDGPGSLNNFIGEPAAGVWQLTMIDNAPFPTGRVDRIGFEITPQSDDLLSGIGVNVTIRGMRFLRRVFTVDVPANATNLSVCVLPQGGPLEVHPARRAADPHGVRCLWHDPRWRRLCHAGPERFASVIGRPLFRSYLQPKRKYRNCERQNPGGPGSQP